MLNIVQNLKEILGGERQIVIKTHQWHKQKLLTIKLH